MRGPEVVAEIKSRIDPVALVGEYVHLQRRGSEYVGLCPFHQEKTPSFTLNPAKGLFYCFGCGEGGDMIRFFERIEGLDFLSALRELGRRVGVEVEDEDPTAQRRQEVLEVAWRYMRRHADRAADFLRRRGLPEDTEVGYDLGDWVSEVDPEVAAELKLVSNRSDRLVSRLRWRYVFPIYHHGRLVGFTGRASSSKQSPKWLYSHFPRRRVLFGLHLTEGRARKAGRIVVVEGPLDALRLLHLGHPSVAILGSSVSQEQVIALARLGVEVWIGLDNDEAGRRGTLKLVQALRGRAPIRVVSWAPYNDPGELPDGFAVQAIPVDQYLWDLTEGLPIEERQRRLAPWLKPVSDLDTLPTALRRRLTAAGAVLPTETPTLPPPTPSRASERLLEADIAAILFSVADPGERSRLASELKLHIFPEVGDLLRQVLEVIGEDNPLEALRRIGAGATFARRIMEAPPYDYDTARRKLLSLARQLSIRQLRTALIEARQRGDLEAAHEASTILEVLRRERYD